MGALRTIEAKYNTGSIANGLQEHVPDYFNFGTTPTNLADKGQEYWTPIDLGPVLWCRYDELDLSGSTVERWIDKSGNANHLTQSNVANQPFFNASDSRVNNRGSLTFDGSDDVLIAPGPINIDVSSGLSFMYVWYRNTKSGRRCLWNRDSSNSFNGWEVDLDNVLNDRIRVHDGGDNIDHAGKITPTSGSGVANRGWIASSSMEMLVNEQTNGVANHTRDISVAQSTEPFSIMAESVRNTGHVTGSMSELVVVQKTITGSVDIDNWKGYLKRYYKWKE